LRVSREYRSGRAFATFAERRTRSAIIGGSPSAENGMATGWAGDGAVQDQIDATVKDAIQRAQLRLPSGPGPTHCAGCGAAIPQARRAALPGVRLCVACQAAHDRERTQFSGYNRRGSKDSQLR
jgi:phage/conjugal plasmid C-4 type zinc finger TraR family protein